MNTFHAIKTLAKTLSLTNLSANLDTLLAPDKTLCNEQFLLAILQGEIAVREGKAHERRLRAAQLPLKKTFEQFDIMCQPNISARQIEALKALSWVETVHNVVLIGPPGVGKTHLALAISWQALASGYKVFFTSMDKLVHLLKTAEISRSSTARLAYLHKCDLVVIDEFGYLPISRVEANLFFQLISKLHDKTSIVLTTNKGFSDWPQALPDAALTTALLDRITFRCQIIPLDGDSYRLSHRSNIFT
jgi:DNA replication protein DnaC